MKVYSLVGFIDYGGLDLLGVFGSLEDLMKFVEYERESCSYHKETLAFDHLGYVVSELGSKLDTLRDVEYL